MTGTQFVRVNFICQEEACKGHTEAFRVHEKDLELIIKSAAAKEVKINMERNIRGTYELQTVEDYTAFVDAVIDTGYDWRHTREHGSLLSTIYKPVTHGAKSAEVLHKKLFSYRDPSKHRGEHGIEKAERAAENNLRSH